MRAGFSTAVITPKTPVYLAGFGDRSDPAQDVHDDLEARALHLDDGSGVLCLVVCDLLGMTPDFSRPIRERIAGELGVSIDAVLVSCTHTHSGPSTMAGSDALGWKIQQGYDAVLSDGCLAAAVAARDAAADVELRFARGPLPGDLSFNRRGSAYPDPEVATLEVLGSGRRVGIVANLGVHPVALGPENLSVSTDWVGCLRSALEQRSSETAIELTGALGDINPTPPGHHIGDDLYAPWCSFGETATLGAALADAVETVASEATPVEGGLSVLRAETVEIPTGTTPLSQLAGASGKMSVEFVEWAIGDVRLVSIPGEAFHALGKEIVDARGPRTLLAGIAPAWHGYLPHPWGVGYEETVSFGEEAVAAMRSKLLAAP